MRRLRRRQRDGGSLITGALMPHMISRQPAPVRLRLETARKRRIPNVQGNLLTVYDREAWEWLRRDYGTRITVRTPLTPTYNCHGLTFASRRTRVLDGDTVEKILRDDGYQPIAHSDVLAGDVAIYFNPDTGLIDHSGVVVHPVPSPPYIPVLVSKWGSGPEVVHPANVGPFDPGAIRYFRAYL